MAGKMAKKKKKIIPVMWERLDGRDQETMS